MKEWIGYYENILSDEISDGIMNIKDGWKPSTYSNHKGNIGLEKSRERVIMDENYIKNGNTYWAPLCNVTRLTIDLYKKKHPYMIRFMPQKLTDFSIEKIDEILKNKKEDILKV